MTTDAIESKISALLGNGIPEVIAIKGRWGVGKTYFWNRLTKKLAKAQALGLSKYSYVSLFGVGNLEQLKTAIFEQTIHRSNIVAGVTLKTVKENLRDFASIWEDPSKPNTAQAKELGLVALLRRSLSITSTLPYVQGVSSALRSGAFLLVRDTLICIDDLERKGNQLEIRDILGLMSFLKEQRNCKLALIFNDGSLDKLAAQQYAEYREKVVDVELEYIPTVDQIVGLILDKTDPNFTQVLDRAKVLNITNIRIIQKIKRTLDDLSPFLIGREPATVAAVCVTVVLLCWAFFSRETDGPTLDYIQSLGSSFLWRTEEKKPKNVFRQAEQPKLSPEQQELENRIERWNEVLKSYGWLYTDDFDQAIARQIRQGMPDAALLNTELDKKDAEFRDAMGKDAVMKIWRQFHDSFKDDKDSFVQNLIETMHRNFPYVSRDQLNGAVKLLRDLGHNKEADALVDGFVQAHEKQPKAFVLESFFPDEQPLDPYLRSRFAEKSGLADTPMQLAEVVHRIAANDSWSGSDEEFLSSLSSDNYYAFFKQQESEYLHSYIRALLRFGKFGNAQERQLKIAAATTSALQRLAAESAINALRLRRYDLPPPQ